MNRDVEQARGRSHRFWVGLYFLSVAIIGALRISDAINGPTGFILLAAATGILIPITRKGHDGSG